MKRSVKLISAVALTALLSAASVSCGRSEPVAPAHEHSYTENVTQPTCTEQGFTEYTCNCGYSYTSEYVNATGHKFTDVTTALPDCTHQGYTTYACDCGYSYDGDFVNATGHDISYESDEKNHWTVCNTCNYKTDAVLHEYKDRVCECGHENATEGLKFKTNVDGTYTVTDYDGTDTEIYIPSKHDGKRVTEIARGAFSSSKIAKATVANGVQKISKIAFAYCTNLTEVYLPESVTAIESGAFEGCSSLARISIPKNVAKIDSSTFKDCTKLVSVELPDTLSVIGSNAFSGCALETLSLPDTVVSIGELAFSGSALKTISIPDKVVSLGDEAFESCKDLVGVALGKGITQIGYRLFYGCDKLKTVTVTGEVTAINKAAFRDCRALGDLALPVTLESIGSEAFFGCIGMTAVNMPDSVISIGDLAFASCTALTEIAFGKGLTTVGARMLESCVALRKISVSGDNAYFSGSGNCLTDRRTKTLIAGCKASVIPNDGSVTVIGERAFAGCVELTDAAVPDGVTKILSSAFEDCGKLRTVTLGASVVSIGSHAFYNCTGITTVKFFGTQEQWNSIKIGAGNNSIKTATLVLSTAI